MAICAYHSAIAPQNLCLHHPLWKSKVTVVGHPVSWTLGSNRVRRDVEQALGYFFFYFLVVLVWSWDQVYILFYGRACFFFFLVWLLSLLCCSCCCWNNILKVCSNTAVIIGAPNGHEAFPMIAITAATSRELWVDLKSPCDPIIRWTIGACLV